MNLIKQRAELKNFSLNQIETELGLFLKVSFRIFNTFKGKYST